MEEEGAGGGASVAAPLPAGEVPERGQTASRLRLFSANGVGVGPSYASVAAPLRHLSRPETTLLRLKTADQWGAGGPRGSGEGPSAR
jgi:hypothetical protein